MFNDLLDETKGFKYQTILKVKFKKYIGSKIEVSPVFFNTTIKTMINHEFKLDRSFQEILYRFDNWINESSHWVVESIKSQYIDISIFRSLLESSI